MIRAEIVAHSRNHQGDELISVLATFPRIILAEVNTHRMLSKNTSSSRAIPFNKMVESVQNDPFVPIAWQFNHKGMQGTEYVTEESDFGGISARNESWLSARDYAIQQAKDLNSMDTTKQLCNRLLEPFMWTTMLITGPKSGWDNFFHLRNPVYDISASNSKGTFKSWKDVLKHSEKYHTKEEQEYIKSCPEIKKLEFNKGQAEIHMMALAEKIYDAMNESTPKQLKAGEWHIPFVDKIGEITCIPIAKNSPDYKQVLQGTQVMVSVAMAARTSYTIVGEEKEIDYSKMIDLHDRLIAQDPPHSSPLEHCARAMSDEEHGSYIKGKIDLIDVDEPEYNGGIYEPKFSEKGWCNNFKGFIPYRYLVDNSISL